MRRSVRSINYINEYTQPNCSLTHRCYRWGQHLHGSEVEPQPHAHGGTHRAGIIMQLVPELVAGSRSACPRTRGGAQAVAIAKATWAWVRGKCEEAMRKVLGACRQARSRHRQWQQRRDERRGGERRVARRATDAMGHKAASAHGYATHTNPQGFIIRPPLLTTNNAFLRSVSRWGR